MLINQEIIMNYIFSNKNRIFKLNKYSSAASLAAESEKIEAWAEAAMLWVQASSLARNTINESWADKRAEYCLKKINISV
jgi:hypothetical protein